MAVGKVLDKDRSYKRTVLLITCLGALMGPLDSTIVSVSLPTMSSDLNMDYATSIWVPTAYLVAVCALLLTVGRLSDIRGRKTIFISGFSLFVVGSFLCSIATSGAELIAFRVLQGSGAAFIMATSTAIVTDVFPSKDRGKALGINAMATYLGLSIGPALGGILTVAFGWRSIFLVNVPIGIAVIILAAWKLKDTGVRHSVPFDITGTVTFASGLVFLLVALTLGDQLGWTSFAIMGLLVLAVLCLSFFVYTENRKGKGALFDFEIIRSNRLFAYANLATLLNYTAYYAVAFIMSFYLQRVLGLSLLETGLILLLMPLTMSILSPISGRMSDRMGSKISEHWWNDTCGCWALFAQHFERYLEPNGDNNIPIGPGCGHGNILLA